MKTKLFPVIIALSLLTALTSAVLADADIPPAANPFDSESAKPESVRIGGYQTQPVDFNMNTVIRYTGEPVSLTFRFVGTGSDTEVGIMFFLDGVLQPHTASNADDDTPVTISRVRFGAEDSEEVTFTFTPATGKKGDSLGLQTARVFFPDYVPDDPMGSFGIYQSGNFFFPLTVEMAADVPEAGRSFELDCAEEEIPDELRERNTSPENPTGEFTSSRFDFFAGDDRFNNDPIYTDGAETHEFTLQGYGGIEADYRLTFFLDNRPLEIAGGENAVIHVPYGKMTRCTVPLTLPAVRPLSPLTAALVPIGESFLSEEAQYWLTHPIKIALK